MSGASTARKSSRSWPSVDQRLSRPNGSGYRSSRSSHRHRPCTGQRRSSARRFGASASLDPRGERAFAISTNAAMRDFDLANRLPDARTLYLRRLDDRGLNHHHFCVCLGARSERRGVAEPGQSSRRGETAPHDRAHVSRRRGDMREPLRTQSTTIASSSSPSIQCVATASGDGFDRTLPDPGRDPAPSRLPPHVFLQFGIGCLGKRTERVKSCGREGSERSRAPYRAPALPESG